MADCGHCKFSVGVTDGTSFCRWPGTACKPCKDSPDETCGNFVKSEPWICNGCEYETYPGEYNRCSYDPNDNRLHVEWKDRRWQCPHRTVRKNRQLEFEF